MTITKKILSFAVTVTMLLQISSFTVPAFALDEETQTTDIYKIYRDSSNLYKGNTSLEEGSIQDRPEGIDRPDTPAGNWGDWNGNGSDVDVSISTTQAYDGEKSLLVKKKDRGGSQYVAPKAINKVRNGATYVASAMVLGTEANSTTAFNADPAKGAAKQYWQEFYLVEYKYGTTTSRLNRNTIKHKDLAQAPLASTSPQDKLDASEWVMLEYGFTTSGVTDYTEIGYGVVFDGKYSEVYIDDYYLGELVVANMDVTAEKTEVTIPESGSVTVALTATAYNQLGNTNYLKLDENEPYTYTLDSAPEGVTISENIITVPADSKAGEIKVTVTANPTFAGYDTQTDEQKALREKVVTIKVEPAPGASTAPKAKNAKIKGAVELNSELKLEYDYWQIFDDGKGGDNSENKSESIASIIWYKGETVNGPWTAFNHGKDSYKITTEDEVDLFYKAEITPVSNKGEKGETKETELCGKPVPPIASNIKITGTQALGEKWTVSYDYSDANGDDEVKPENGGTKIQWYITDSEDIDVEDPAQRKAIDGADSYEITLGNTDEYKGKYVYVGVTPVSDAESETTGIESFSKLRLTSAEPHVTGLSIVKESNYLTVEYTYVHPLGIDPGEPKIEWYNDDTDKFLGDGTSLNVSSLRGETIRVEVTPFAVKEPSKGKMETDEYKVPNASSSSIGGVSGGSSVRPTTPVTPAEIKNIPSWAKSEIDYVLDNKIMEVASENDFAGGNKINRGEFMMAMLKAAGMQPNDYRGSFADVTSLDKFSGYLQAAFDQGVISAADNFYPNRELTRDEMCKIIVTSIEAKTKKEISKASITHFTDYQNIQNWAIDFISQAVSTGIIKGNADGSVNPKGNVTRAEAAVVAKRIAEYVKAEGVLK